MTYIQLLRNSFPDLSFFGNTFVATNLATVLNNSIVVANRKPNSFGFGKTEKQWKMLVRNNLGFELHYFDYTHEELADSENESLESLVRRELDTDELVVVNFHFPEIELDPKIIDKLPEKFGRDVQQFVHLHCLGDFYLGSKETTKYQKRADLLRRALETGVVKRFIAVSEQVKTSFLDVLPHQSIATVANGIPENIYPFRTEPEKEAFRRQFHVNGEYLIGYSGRLDPIKGYENLRAILKWFNDHDQYDVGFLIACANGKNLDTLREDALEKAPRLIKENRLGLILDVAKFVGPVKSLNSFSESYFQSYVEQELVERCPLYRGVSGIPLQSMVDVYLQPSRSEGFGLSALEAVFAGAPVVASNVGGLRLFVKGPFCRLVDQHRSLNVRAEAFGNAIMSVIEDAYGLNREKNTSNERAEARSQVATQYGGRSSAYKTEDVYLGRV